MIIIRVQVTDDGAEVRDVGGRLSGCRVEAGRGVSFFPCAFDVCHLERGLAPTKMEIVGHVLTVCDEGAEVTGGSFLSCLDFC